MFFLAPLLRRHDGETVCESSCHESTPVVSQCDEQWVEVEMTTLNGFKRQSWNSPQAIFSILFYSSEKRCHEMQSELRRYDESRVEPNKSTIKTRFTFEHILLVASLLPLLLHAFLCSREIFLTDLDNRTFRYNFGECLETKCKRLSVLWLSRSHSSRRAQQKWFGIYFNKISRQRITFKTENEWNFHQPMAMTTTTTSSEALVYHVARRMGKVMLFLLAI